MTLAPGQRADCCRVDNMLAATGVKVSESRGRQWTLSRRQMLLGVLVRQ